MEVIFGFQDIIDLRRRQDIEEFIVIVLLQTSQLHLYIVTFLDGLHTAGIICGLELVRMSLTLVEHALLLSHLIIDTEEFASLFLSQPSLLNDKLL